MSTRKPWPGGYIHKQKDGRKLFIIERKINGTRWHVSTRAHDWDAAMAQLAKFEADPANYDPGVSIDATAPVYLTTELVLSYFEYCTRAENLGGKANTRKHAKEKSNRLADWQKDLKGRDLRKLDMIRDLKAALERRRTCRSHRIIAIKSFFAWLRTEKGLIEHAEDRTLNLLVPQAVPAKHKKKKALAWRDVELVLGHLSARYRDVLVLKIATGMHMTELERFVREDTSDLVKAPEGADHLAVMKLLHKNREFALVPLVHKEQVAAATRLRESGTFPSRLNKELKAACVKAAAKLRKEGKPVGGLEEPFTFGVLRHSVASWAIEDGANAALVSQFLGHKDPSTTKRFYIDVNVPVETIPTRRALRLVTG